MKLTRPIKEDGLWVVKEARRYAIMQNDGKLGGYLLFDIALEKVVISGATLEPMKEYLFRIERFVQDGGELTLETLKELTV